MQAPTEMKYQLDILRLIRVSVDMVINTIEVIDVFAPTEEGLDPEKITRRSNAIASVKNAYDVLDSIRRRWEVD
jgi:hypothetical protein